MMAGHSELVAMISLGQMGLCQLLCIKRKICVLRRNIPWRGVRGEKKIWHGITFCINFESYKKTQDNLRSH
jgi:hypothetical protein